MKDKTFWTGACKGNKNAACPVPQDNESPNFYETFAFGTICIPNGDTAVVKALKDNHKRMSLNKTMEQKLTMLLDYFDSVCGDGLFGKLQPYAPEAMETTSCSAFCERSLAMMVLWEIN